MTNIVQLFPASPVPEVTEVPPADPGKFDITAYDFRGEWCRALLGLRKMRVSPHIVERHRVTLTDLGVALAIARTLCRDDDATQYFLKVLTDAVTHRVDTISLGQLAEEYRGFVWTLNYQVIVSASNLVRFRLDRIIETPIERHIFLGVPLP